jgi:hypothetical protein
MGIAQIATVRLSVSNARQKYLIITATGRRDVILVFPNTRPSIPATRIPTEYLTNFNNNIQVAMLDDNNNQFSTS